MLAEGSQFLPHSLSLHTSQPKPLEAGSDEEKMEFLDSLVIQWLGLCTSTAEGMHLNPLVGELKESSSLEAQPKEKNYLAKKNMEFYRRVRSRERN